MSKAHPFHGANGLGIGVRRILEQRLRVELNAHDTTLPGPLVFLLLSLHPLRSSFLFSAQKGSKKKRISMRWLSHFSPFASRRLFNLLAGLVSAPSRSLSSFSPPCSFISLFLLRARTKQLS